MPETATNPSSRFFVAVSFYAQLPQAGSEQQGILCRNQADGWLLVGW